MGCISHLKESVETFFTPPSFSYFCLLGDDAMLVFLALFPVPGLLSRSVQIGPVIPESRTYKITFYNYKSIGRYNIWNGIYFHAFDNEILSPGW